MTDDSASTLPGLATVRRGPGHWLGSYRAMLGFDLASQRGWLPMFVLTQVMFGAGMAIIYGFYVGHAPTIVITYIVTGAPALAAITAGLIGVTTIVSDRQLAGSWDFIWSLPTPRSAAVASTFTVYTAMAMPGMVTALVLSAWRYGIRLAVSPAIVPAFGLSGLTAASVGFAMVVAIRNPLVTNAAVNALIFVVLLFSPVVFPIAQLPGWLAGIQRVLPFYHLAQITRASLTAGMVHGVATSYAVLAIWTVGSWAAAAWVLGRRG